MWRYDGCFFICRRENDQRLPQAGQIEIGISSSSTHQSRDGLGAHGQGASGKLSPRIAGLPKEYIIKAMKDYVAGTRVYPLMVRTSQLDKFTDKDY